MLKKNTLILLVNNGGSALLSFALSVFIGRALGQEGLGVYATALSWVFPLTVIAEFGLGTLITRDVAQHPQDADYYLRLTRRFRWLWSGGIACLLVVAAPLLSTDVTVVRGIQCSAPLIVIAPTFGVVTAVFRAHQQMRPIAALNLGMLLAQVALTIPVLFFTAFGVLGALLVNTVTSAGQLIAAGWMYGTHLTPLPPLQAGEGEKESPLSEAERGFRGEVNRQRTAFLRRAWPFALAGILAAVQLRVGAVLLERLSGTGEAGYYAAANRFVEAARMLPNALFGALFPMLATLSGDLPALHRLFRRVMFGLSAFGVSAGLITLIAAAWVISLTYGDAFAPASDVLRVAVWGLLPALLRAGLTLYAYARGRENVVNAVTLAALIFQIVLCLWWIPLYGAVGLALAGLAVESAAFIMLSGLLAYPP